MMGGFKMFLALIGGVMMNVMMPALVMSAVLSAVT